MANRCQSNIEKDSLILIESFFFVLDNKNATTVIDITDLSFTVPISKKRMETAASILKNFSFLIVLSHEIQHFQQRSRILA